MRALTISCMLHYCGWKQNTFISTSIWFYTMPKVRLMLQVHSRPNCVCRVYCTGMMISVPWLSSLLLCLFGVCVVATCEHTTGQIAPLKAEDIQSLFRTEKCVLCNLCMGKIKINVRDVDVIIMSHFSAENASKKRTSQAMNLISGLGSNTWKGSSNW